MLIKPNPASSTVRAPNRMISLAVTPIESAPIPLETGRKARPIARGP